MISLQVSLPVRPWQKNMPKRFLYKAILDNGRELSLKLLAEKLGISHATLHRDIRDAGFAVGIHGQRFLEMLASTKARKRRNRGSRTKCPTCQGTGRVAREVPI